LALVLAPALARAEPPDRVTFQADRVEADAAQRELTLEGHVELRVDRYRLRGDRIHLRFEDGAVVFGGDAHLALCPCPGPPLTLAAGGGRVEAGGDVRLRLPRLELGGVPVFALPYLWLRPPERVGVLPPIVALRGADGLLLGSGVHLPWRGADGALRALDLTAGGYTLGGAEVGASFVTPETSARVIADLIHGTRVALDARGSLVTEARSGAGVAWDLDAVRGDRARSGTVDLAPAARPFDTAAAEASLRAEAGPVSALVAGGAVARAPRGDGPIAAGPRAFAALGGPIGGLGSWSADASGLVLGGAAPAIGLGRASIGGEIDARPGPFELRAALRARGRVAGADPAISPDASSEAAAAGRVDLELPVARTFAAVPGEAPLVHWITPALGLRGALAAQRGSFFTPIGGAVPPASFLAVAGASSAVGRYAGPALRLDVRAGATAGATTEPMLHARLGVDARVAAASVEAAAVGDRLGTAATARPPDPSALDGTRGFAFLARTRLGPDDRPSLRLDVAAQGGAGAGAGQARAIAAGAWAALPGDDLAYLAAAGWSGGAELSIPWASAFRTAARVDADLTGHALLSVRGLAAYRHPCGCLAVGVLGAHRAGREGFDLAATIDMVPPVRAGQPAGGR
jgi:hypothetical protein